MQLQGDGAIVEREVPLSSKRTPVWHDEDDEDIRCVNQSISENSLYQAGLVAFFPFSVDISAHQRSRKLRKVEGETTISGTTYQQRLRTQ